LFGWRGRERERRDLESWTKVPCFSCLDHRVMNEIKKTEKCGEVAYTLSRKRFSPVVVFNSANVSSSFTRQTNKQTRVKKDTISPQFQYH